MSAGAVFSSEEIIQATGAQPVSGEVAESFQGVSIDSRSIRPKQLFIAIRGRRFDGHDFVAQAFREGAAGAILENLPKGEIPGTIWKVSDTLMALGDLAGFHRRRFQIPVVAITGSSGKTTTKMMIQHLLSARREVLATVGTQNNLIGVPLLLLSLAQHLDAAVVELGTNQWGEIRRLSEIAQPSLGVVTNVGPAHLQTFVDLQGVLREKAGLWERMPPDAPLVLPADDPILWEAGKRLTRRVIWFGSHPKAHLRASEIQLHSWGSECLVNDRWKLSLSLPGLHSLKNALAALACVQELGCDMGEAVQGLAGVLGLEGRLTQKHFNGCLVLDDTYNANPASLKAALEVLRGHRSSKRKVAVLGDMLELGDQARALHEEAGRWIQECGVDLLVAVGPLARFLLEGARGAGLSKDRCFSFETPEEAGEFLSSSIRSGDVVLIKGSRGMQMERVLSSSITSSIH